MITNVLVMTFADEVGKERRLSVGYAKDELDALTVKSAAQEIIDSGAFSVKGKFVSVLKGQLVKTDKTLLFSE